MSTATPAKPIFKAPETKPFKSAEPLPMDPVTDAAAKAAPPSAKSTDGWRPIATVPQEADARFMVRATANGKGISGTETMVRYRASRKMVGGKWKPALTIIDDKLGTKLGFRPTEWTEAND